MDTHCCEAIEGERLYGSSSGTSASNSTYRYGAGGVDVSAV